MERLATYRPLARAGEDDLFRISLDVALRLRLSLDGLWSHRFGTEQNDRMPSWLAVGRRSFGALCHAKSSTHQSNQTQPDFGFVLLLLASPDERAKLVDQYERR